MQSGSNNSAPNTPSGVISAELMELEREKHRSILAPWVEDRTGRANHRTPHPVYDFLFTYYSFAPARLLRWSPGADTSVSIQTPTLLDWNTYFVPSDHGWVIPSTSFPEHRRGYLLWCVRYLENTSERPPFFGCFGLHEWAMLYHAPIPRHTIVPLRVSPNTIATTVDSLQLRCTHYDAYRFFTPQALPLNKHRLSRIETTNFDQPACIHTSMDLYRFAYKIAPWCPSVLIREAFLLACKARTIDMQASPYDLLAYGLQPICIETTAGREEYIHRQKELLADAQPIRHALLEVYRHMLEHNFKNNPSHR